MSLVFRIRYLRLAERERRAVVASGDAYPTVILVGCAIAVYKDYFNHIGTFDEGMKIWGGENIDLALRAWTCGGRVSVVPCSRVGHLFKPISYSFDGDKFKVTAVNQMRVAELWLGETYRRLFYATTRAYKEKQANFTDEDIVSLQQRFKLKKYRNCSANYEVILNQIVPGIESPPFDADYYGAILNILGTCWQVTEANLGSVIVLDTFCKHYPAYVKTDNNFILSDSGKLLYRDKCVLAEPETGLLTVGKCPQDMVKWTMVLLFKESPGPAAYTGQLQVSIATGAEEKKHVYCIETAVLEEKPEQQMPVLASCNSSNAAQYWTFHYPLRWDRVPPPLFE